MESKRPRFFFVAHFTEGKVQSVMSWIKDVTAEKVRRSSADRKKEPGSR